MFYYLLFKAREKQDALVDKEGRNCCTCNPTSLLWVILK